MSPDRWGMQEAFEEMVYFCQGLFINEACYFTCPLAGQHEDHHPPVLDPCGGRLRLAHCPPRAHPLTWDLWSGMM